MPNPVDVKVGENVRTIRRQLGLSQSAAAEGCGVSFQQMQKYENAKNRISASRLVQLSRLMKVPVSAFFDGIKQG